MKRINVIIRTILHIHRLLLIFKLILNHNLLRTYFKHQYFYDIHKKKSLFLENKYLKNYAIYLIFFNFIKSRFLTKHVNDRYILMYIYIYKFFNYYIK